MRLIKLIIIAALIGACATAKAAAARPAETERGLRLHGTFIQYQPWMMQLDVVAWERELEAMRRAGLRTIVIQWLARNDGTFMPDPAGGLDPTETILTYADRHEMEVFLGLFMDDGWWNWTPATGLPERLVARTRTTAEQAWARYGRHASLAGWYIPPEPADSLASECIPALRTFLRDTSDLCKRLSGGRAVAFSPFLTGQADPQQVERTYADLLAGAGIDIVLLQDGVGARNWDATVHSRVVPLFRAMRDACLSAGAELWSDVEIFHNESNDPAKPRFIPSDTQRLARQLAAEAPFVDRFIAFDCFHYMSPYRGERQRAFHEAYVRDFVDRAFFPIHGAGLIVDPSFAYYRDRSPESIATEIRANGYSVVHYIAEPSVRVDRRLVDAFHDAGIGVWCQVFGNGTYSSGHLPPEWRRWSMVTRTHLAGGTLPGYERLCLNNAEYREWKKKDLAAAIKAGGFDGIEIAEPYWPEYPGPDSPAYACFCEACREAFTRRYPEESALPDILDANSPRSPSRNPTLWSKWLAFRQASHTAFLDDLVNGPGGLRQTCPGVAVCVWGLALVEPDGVQKIREYHGQDAGEVAATVKPDVYCFQTHWPDWTRADLPPDYVEAYLPFIRQLREHAPGVPLMIQTDIGSNREAIRDRTWIERFERVCEEMGVPSTCCYEYFIGGWTYQEPPRVAAVRRAQGRIGVTFTRRIDPATARRPGAFELDGQPTVVLGVDGSQVLLRDPAPDDHTRLTVRRIGDETGRRLFTEYPPSILPEQSVTLPANAKKMSAFAE